MTQRKIKMKKGAGFTLFEMLIVSFIIGLLATVVVVTLRKSNQESNLRFASQNLESVFKQAQTMTFAGKTIPGSGGGGGGCGGGGGGGGASDEVPPGGYGIYINASTSYILFADEDGNGSYDSGEELENIDLPNKIEFFESGGGALISTVVTFLPPQGGMKIKRYLGGSWTPVDDLTLNLRITNDPTKTRKIYINSTSGLIEERE